MYKSGKEIEKKLKQTKYVYNQILKFKNRVFINNGIDEKTGSYPLLTHISSFLALSRSVFQYAHKEADQSGLLSRYDDFVKNSEIVRFFKEIRDSDIHEYTINTHYTIKGDSPIGSSDPKTGIAVGKVVKLYVESLSDLDSPKDQNEEMEITVSIGKRIKIDSALIKQLEDKGDTDLVAAAQNGEELYEELSCNGEKDIFRLCENYLNEIKRFIKYGRDINFIT